MASKRSGRPNGTWTFSAKCNPSPALLLRQFTWLGDMFKDWRPAWQKLAPRLRTGEAAVWASKGAAIENPVGQTPWRPIKRDARRSPLSDSGLLESMCTSPAAVLAMTKSGLTFGIVGKEVQALQFGSTKRNIPARMFVGWSREMKDAATEEVSNYAQDLLDIMAQRLQAAGEGNLSAAQGVAG